MKVSGAREVRGVSGVREVRGARGRTHPGEVHAQFQLGQEVQDDTALLFHGLELLLLVRRRVLQLLVSIYLLLLLKGHSTHTHTQTLSSL